MVPNGWESKPLVKLLDRIIDYRGQSVPKASFGIPLITARNVRDGYLDFSSQEYVDESKFEAWMSRGVPSKGDILFTTEAPLGKACRYPTKGQFAVGQRTVTLRTNNQLDSEFLLYTLLSERGQRLIDIRSSGSTAKGIKSSELKKVKISYPESLPEQRKIAKILSTWDKAISTTEKLIETSKQQKKALMQQLLTGKKRLVNPETGKAFEGEWDEVKLSEIAKVSIGLVTTMTKHYVESGVPLIRNSDIKQNEIRKEKMIYLSESFASESEHRKLKLNDVVTVHTGEVGVSAVIDADMAGSLGFATLNSRPNVNKVLPTYLSWYFNSDSFINWCVSMSTGDGRQNLNLKDFVKAIVLLPELTEQQKIASVLTAADKEIEALQAKLAHFKQEKKALMQQLLTGKRRVKVDEMEVA